MSNSIRAGEVKAGGLTFSILEAGTGPLALCLHGFPDTAHTWRHLLPALADAGFRAVAPFMRGYAPTQVPEDGCYSPGALVSDIDALHEALNGDGTAVLLGHDWGAVAAYGAAAFAPDRWRRLVTLSIPPPALDDVVLQDFNQLKRSFYAYLFLAPYAEDLASADDMALVARLWKEWSPGYDHDVDMAFVRKSLGARDNLSAALGYYRASAGFGPVSEKHDDHALAFERPAPQPTLYLHGAQDGCVSSRWTETSLAHLAPGSRTSVVDEAGHFLHLEKPAKVNGAIVQWLVQNR
ncbi:alpha/beta fold hydrolase [Saccharopolyspora tripterygii]